MNALDLFSGLEGWATAFRARGYDVVTLDLDTRFGADHVRDILSVHDLATLERDGPFDVILASPPCEAFSTGSIGRHWGGGARAYEPKSDAARLALRIVAHTFYLIDLYVYTHPSTRYVVENPRGVMRKVAPRPPTGTTWYCQWGEHRAKPTDLWTNMPGALGGTPFPACHNYRVRKALGQTGGTQGLANAAERALIPARLADAFATWALPLHQHLGDLT